MSDQVPDQKDDVGGSPADTGISRRRVMAGAAVGGLGLTAVGSRADGAVTTNAVGLGRVGSTTVEFRGRIDQTGPSGQSFTSYGFITRATNAPSTALFDGSPPSASTALLTAFATGDLTARVLDMSVHSLDIVGVMRIYQRTAPGADFTDPDSFKLGSLVARYQLVLQDVLAVYAAGQGIPTLSGDMRQTAAHTLGGPLAGQTFGQVGTRLHLFATGLGRLTDPVTLNAQLEIAGSWSIE
jgi:hypothetical protein